ncbi:MAG: hypothetical protein IKS41_05695 [Alphaproteobacteria bacterium]|nr:hypothetical protein [Alphaproteobacteria bacterium]
MLEERIIEGIRDCVKYVSDKELRPALQAILMIYDGAKEKNKAQILDFLKIMDDLETKGAENGQ